ncbi:MAG TPA: dienelactone hydrolase family protein [Candidatus Binatia bacterium]|jgi:carboxymethylenebutenolidase
MSEELKALIRDYRDGKISRREFVLKSFRIAGGVAAAGALFGCAAAGEAVGERSEVQLLAANVEFKGKSGPISGYLARPGTRQSPGVVVTHANQGINEYSRDIARRLARAGYAALAVDFLSRHGGSAKVNPKGEGLGNIRELAPWQAVAEDSAAACDYLRSLSYVRGDRLGTVGFCWGGEMTFSSATEVRGLSAVVVFYGRSPKPLERVKTIEAPVLAHYGEKDPGVNQDIPGTVEAMKKYGKSYTYKIYPGAQHGFHTDTSDRYHPEAAKEAWARTLDFFHANLQRA